jgi:pantoate--beta-alanine ligase
MDVVTLVGAMADFGANAARRGVSHGFVPTMGALHRGHLGLVARSLAENDVTTVSIFVNPLQFAPGEDYLRYPRPRDSDQALLAAARATVLFAPSPEEMYGAGFTTRVDVGPMGLVLEGAVRPGHFAGVATVVLKLLLIVQPTRLYLGRKDAQQVAVLARMIRDLSVPVEVVPCPTAREPDGLALSSRNVYLTPEERARAPLLHRALRAARERFREGERTRDGIVAPARGILAAEPALHVDYLELRDETTFAAAPEPVTDGRVLVAARLGSTRLIDNLGLREEDA